MVSQIDMDENLSLEVVPLQRPHLFVVQRRKGGSSAEGSRQNSSSSSSNRCIKSSTGLLAKCMLPIEFRSTHSKSLLVGPPLCPAAAHAAAATAAAAATGYTVPRPVHAALHTCNLHSYRGASTSVDRQPQRAHLLQGPFKGPPKWDGASRGPPKWGAPFRGPFKWEAPYRGPLKWGGPYRGPLKWGGLFKGPLN